MKHFYLIGRDIGFSLSPQIHKEVFAHLGVCADYGLMPLSNVGEFAEIDLLNGNVGGFNVTTPYKSSILEHVSRDFSGCGSVNTLKIVVGGGIEGYSTDGRGFILDAQRLKLDLSRVLIVGFGGAAKSIAHELKKQNSQIGILSKHLPQDSLQHDDLPYYNQFQDIKPTLTVNCSGFDISFAQPCYDLRYVNAQSGCLNGLGMLIYQALLADEIFLDRAIDLSLFDSIYKKLH